jgi:hypothetical protein
MAEGQWEKDLFAHEHYRICKKVPMYFWAELL